MTNAVGATARWLRHLRGVHVHLPAVVNAAATAAWHCANIMARQRTEPLAIDLMKPPSRCHRRRHRHRHRDSVPVVSVGNHPVRVIH